MKNGQYEKNGEHVFDTGTISYEKNTIKIRKWEDLNGAEEAIYKIEVNSQDIYVLNVISKHYICRILREHVLNNNIIRVLEVFGFNVELITTPKLTKAEWHALNYYKLTHDAVIVKKIRNGLNAYYDKHGLVQSTCHDGLFEFIKEGDKAYNIDEMLTWEVIGE
jgi:hypothetical protein